ncbi:hypothetical protein [Elizabethkingia ursingii]
MQKKFHSLSCNKRIQKYCLYTLLFILSLSIESCNRNSYIEENQSKISLKDEDTEEVEIIRRKYLDSLDILRKGKIDKVIENGSLSLKREDMPGAFVREIRYLISSVANEYSNDLSQQLIDSYSETLDQLIRKGTGTWTYGHDKTDLYENNAFKKLVLPETTYWDTRKDNTYHSYDLVRNLGPETEMITLAYINDLLFNSYSYPGYKLTRVSNVVNGGTKLVFGSLLNANNANTFTNPGGIIEQQTVTNGILNITTTEHTFYKGTVRRAVFRYKNNLFLATHGEGINRFNNLPNNFINKALFKKFSKINDNQGPISFKTLDEQIQKALLR